MYKPDAEKLFGLLPLPDYHTTDEVWLTRQHVLRLLIGVLGMLLPLLLPLFLFIDSGQASPLPSISHYYFTRVCAVFIIIVSALAIFLLIYKGHDRRDFWLSSLAGFGALLLLLFPTDNLSASACVQPGAVAVTVLPESIFRMQFHYGCAAVFLCSLAFMSAFQFTRSGKANPKERTPQKRRRNRIYRFCAVMMLVAIVVMLAGLLGWIPQELYETYKLTFLMEAVAVEFFGFSWLVKSEAILADANPGRARNRRSPTQP